ncbi:hypothetical protein DRN58_08725, partial [Thermococci archaeon]
FMNEEKEKGIEELYNYLVKNKDKMSKEEYNDLKKILKSPYPKHIQKNPYQKDFLKNIMKKSKS